MSQSCVTAIRIQHLINMKYGAQEKIRLTGLIQSFLYHGVSRVCFRCPCPFITRIQSICTPREVSEAAVCLLPIFKPDQMGDKHFEG